MEIVWDIEANNLLNDETVDYTSSPYKLKATFMMHCIVIEDFHTGDIYAFYDGDKIELDGSCYTTEDKELEVTYILEDYEPVDYKHFQLSEFPDFLSKYNVTKAIAHNGINYDWLVCKLKYGMDYKMTYQGKKGSWNGVEMDLEDTMILSKTLNPDRGGHSLDFLSERAGYRKIDFRPQVKNKSLKFKTFAEDMLYYCIVDTRATTKVYRMLKAEQGNWAWDDALELEHNVAEIITRQAHRGFNFDIELAESNVKELDKLMAECTDRAGKHLPMRTPTKGFMASVTPPKRQFLKSGLPSSFMNKFAAKHSGELYEDDNGWNIKIFDRDLPLPLADEPLITEVQATLDDSVAIKEWLVGLGWIPSEFKEKDLTTKSGTKIKRTKEEFEETVDKYVEETLASNFCEQRCLIMEISPSQLAAKLKARKRNRPIKVPTNPNYTAGQDKEMCPGLETVAEKFPFAQDAINYLTYKHRRNSILGEGLNWEEVDEATTGYMGKVREDGRIATPADTIGAGSFRFTHKDVANIPRTTSLYGEKMRKLFGVTDGMYQIGYDFDSLEAKVESHFCHRYDHSKAYCNSLTQPKPNDCHTILSKQISELLSREFSRGSAKNVKYGCVPVDNTEVLTTEGWKWFEDLAEGQEVVAYEPVYGSLVDCTISKVHHYKDADTVLKGDGDWGIESTDDHRWHGFDSSKKAIPKYSSKAYHTGHLSEVRYTQDFSDSFNIVNSAYYHGSQIYLTGACEEVKLIAMILATGSMFKLRGGGVECNIYVRDSYALGSELVEEVIDSCCVGMTKSCKNVGGSYLTSYTLDSDRIQRILEAYAYDWSDVNTYDWARWVMELGYQERSSFLTTFLHASPNSTEEEDGIVKTKVRKGNVCSGVVMAAFLSGYKVTETKSEDPKSRFSDITINKNQEYTSTKGFKEINRRKTDVFCLTTMFDSFVIRQNGVVTITGNCSYNAQPPRVARTIGCSLEEGKLIFDTFWQQAFPLKRLKEKMQEYWEDTGNKKFLLGIDGRKLPVRSKGNVVNTAFQSTGVICAKRAMLIHDKMVEEKGLKVDFFKDDWKNSSFCQQMIAYHDEAQLEVTGDLVEFKVFKDLKVDRNLSKKEKEALTKETDRRILEISESTGKLWSELSEGTEFYYTAYCEAGELSTKAVSMSGEYYNLKVPLTAGYIIHKDWGGCH